MAISEAQADDLRNRFSYHPPEDEDDVRAYREIRDYGHGFASLVLNHAPESRERSLALTKIEEAVMWANAARARHGNHE